MNLTALKPAAPRSVHLLAASLTWTIVGGLLLATGVRWLVQAREDTWQWWLGAAIVLGAAKAQLALRRTARRAIDRIRTRGDGRCLGGFFSIKTWLVVLLMIVVGRLLRTSGLPGEIAGLIYAAVGAALLLGGLAFWKAFGQCIRSASESD